MNYVSERDIQDIVARVLSQQGLGCGAKSSSCGQEIPVEISARHVHLDEAALEVLFGKGAKLFLLGAPGSLRKKGLALSPPGCRPAPGARLPFRGAVTRAA